MGRPLFSTLIEPTVRVSEPVYTDEVVKGGGAACERWSISNPFDPDDDAFFDNEHAVYEAFLTEDEVQAQAQATRNAFSTTNGARASRLGASTASMVEMQRHFADTRNFHVPFEDLMGRGQSRAQTEARIVAVNELLQARRSAPNRPENGSTIPRAGVRIRARVMNRMISGDSTTVAPSSPRREAGENTHAEGLGNRVGGSSTVTRGSTETQPTYPIRSAYSEERVRIPREQQEREIRESQMLLREAYLRAGEASRNRNATHEEHPELAHELQSRRVESYDARPRRTDQGGQGSRYLDDVVERMREHTALSASLIQRFPDSVEAREARDALNDADAMIEETLRRDDEMEQEIRASQDRDQNQEGDERNERLRAIQSRRIAINTDLDSLRPSRALSPSSVAASATSSSGSSRIVAPRMARSPISPPSAMPLHAFALPNMRSRTRSRRTQQSDADSLDDMPGLLEVENSSEDEDSSQTDGSSDWSTDFSGRSSPAEDRANFSPRYLVPIAPPRGHFDRHDWSFDGLRAERVAERSPSPPDLIVNTPLSLEAPHTPDSISSDTAQLSSSPSTVYSTMPIPIPIPTTPSRAHARNASSGTPSAGGVLSMTPPASVTPRFLTWGGRSASPPNPAPASPSANRRRRTSTTLPWLSSQNWNAF